MDVGRALALYRTTKNNKRQRDQNELEALREQRVIDARKEARLNFKYTTGRNRSRNNRNAGAFAVAPPVATGMVVSRRSVPKINSVGSSTIVRNTEAFVDITSTALGVYSIQPQAMIPGNPTWLAAIADLYSKYRWRKLRLVWVPSCPTTTQGSCGIAISYDRIDAAPTSMVALQQSYKAITFPPYAGYNAAMALQTFGNVEGMVAFDVDVTRFDKAWYPVIQNATLAGFASNIQNPYVPCTMLFGAANGPAAATFFGTWYVQYEVEFIEPINPTQNV
nr:MAG: hypothetical protein 4 [Regressovirinae sp.]